MDDVEELQSRISHFETINGFDTGKFIERIRDANDKMLDVPNLEVWFAAYHAFSHLKMEKRQRGLFESSGMESDFSYLDSCVYRRIKEREQADITS